MFERKPPIRSTHEDIAELADALDRFVIGLADGVDAIQDAELAGDFSIVPKLARSMASDAERLGYPAMAVGARNVALAAEDGKADTLQDAIVELTDLAMRVRQGHRGAA